MEVREYLRQAIEATASHPRRAIASSMGVFWGSAAIVVLLAWGSGFHRYMYGELQRYGRPMVFLMAGITSSGFPGHRAGVPVELSRSDVAAAERATAELAVAILPEHLSGSGDRVLVRVGERVRRLDLSGVDERFAEYRKFRIGTGRFLDRSDVENRRAVAVLGHEAASDLFGDPASALGRRLRIEGHSFRVVGVADPKGRQYMNTNRPDNRLVMIPITTAEVRLGFSDERVERINIYPRLGVSGKRVVAAVVASFAERAGFHPKDTDAVRWFDLSDLLKLIDRIHAGFIVFLGIAGTITLLVAGVGIANFHLAILAERTVEIGVAKAIGARSRVLVVQTVLESLTVSGAAAVLGVGTGLVVCVALGRLAPPGLFPTPVISPPVVLITLSALVGVASVAAVVPALRVRRMDVSAALRSAA